MKMTMYISRWLASFLLPTAIFATPVSAQDSRYAPFTFMEELIPALPCLTMRNAWKGGSVPCTPLTHQEWLADITHWRAERSHEWQKTAQALVEIAPTKVATSVPEVMIRVEGGDYQFTVQGIEIEGSNDIGVDVQYPWEDSPRRFHEHRMQIKPFYIDKYPVTNAEFKTFLDSSKYHPKDDLNFLKNWKGGTFPEGAADKPVTWVSIEDAREYAKWAGKRLPHEWEWQYAAQGNDSRQFPWGNCDWLLPQLPGGVPSCASQAGAAETFAPLPDKGREMQAASDVKAHPKGASPFGVMDMVGNVWPWTDEYVDEHTRAAILRGGSHYRPQGSVWYFPQAYKNGEHGKLLLMAPSYDRSGTVGFRCVKDAK
jgi:iron(II)-dependent oxidoreductase